MKIVFVMAIFFNVCKLVYFLSFIPSDSYDLLYMFLDHQIHSI